MGRQKRFLKITLIALALVALVLSVGYTSRKGATSEPAAPLKFEPTAARYERGRYLVESVAHCFQCHSEVNWEAPGAQPKTGRKGAGTIFVEDGMEWLVAPNITPDVETGAGKWTDEQFARAIREGIGHDGRRLFPMMPYMNFQQMSDEDLASVVVYVRSIDSVRNVVPKTMIPEGLKGILPPHQPITGPVVGPDMSDPVARGKYLVTLGNCLSCHTPMNATAKRELHHRLALLVENVAHGTRRRTQAQLHLMPWGYFRNMTDDDLKAPDPSGISYYDEALFMMHFKGPWGDVTSANITRSSLTCGR